jgi:hypothetical protein
VKNLLLFVMIVLAPVSSAFAVADTKTELSVAYSEVPPTESKGSVFGLPSGSLSFGKAELEVKVDIPGLPKLDKQEMTMVLYAGEIPEAWHSATIMWYPEDCSGLNAHIAVRWDAGLDTALNALYHVGFRKAIYQAGIDHCRRVKEGRDRFSYAGKTWTDLQLEETAAEIGAIRGAREAREGYLILERLRAKSASSYPNYALIKFLFEATKQDPDKFESEFKRAVGAYLEQAKE